MQCRSWRSVILSDSQLLQTLKFSEAQAPLALMRQYSEGQACPVGTGLPVTNLIDKASCSCSLLLSQFTPLMSQEKASKKGLPDLNGIMQNSGFKSLGYYDMRFPSAMRCPLNPRLSPFAEHVHQSEDTWLQAES